jgi:exonuclease SbcC
MTEKFRLKSVVIEGFKGFTSPQKIEFNGKTTFIFGPNGCGKSSILEAISWCMFGLDRENESEIRNRDYYSGDCKVEITLVRGKEEWKVIRKLKPDSGKSDVEVVSPQGERKRLTEVFPQLRKLGGRGANVIFAQQGTTHRFVGDLNKFKDVIDAYLGLDRLEKLRKLLLDEITDRKEKHYEKQIKREWGEFEKNINNKIQDVENKLNEISSNPPWVDTSPPTESETKTKLVTLYREVSNFLGVHINGSISTLPMKEIIDKISSLLDSSVVLGGISEGIKQKKDTKSRLEDMKRKYEEIHNEINKTKDKKRNLETELSKLLSTENEEGLKKKIEKLEEEDNKLLQELYTAVLNHKRAEEAFITKLHEIESEIKTLTTNMDRLSSLQREILDNKQLLDSLTRDATLDELEKRCNELKNQGGKLREYLNLITVAIEYCSKHRCTHCPLCDSNSDILLKLQEKKSAIPQEISDITNEIKLLNDRIQTINEISSKLTALERKKEELTRSMPEKPDDKLKELENKKQALIQQQEIDRNKMEQLKKEVPEKRNQIQVEINSIRKSLEKITSLRKQIQDCERELKSLEDEKRKIEEDVKKALRLSMDTEIDLKKLEDAICDIGSKILDLERELHDKTSGLNTYKSRLNNLKKEVEYHRLLKRSADLLKLKDSEDWKQIEELIKEFLTLCDSVQEICDALGKAYEEEFNKHVKDIDQKVNEVYKTLTAQRSYPDARVLQKPSDSGSIEIIMEVGVSERDIWRRPIEVLNEQAKNAVVLVPYFAFSELGMLQHDLDFLLIDDPSRSFDIEHLDSLMRLLKSVSDHAQVILATHEREKFEEQVKELFGPNANILEVVGFNPESGPQIKEVSI